MCKLKDIKYNKCPPVDINDKIIDINIALSKDYILQGSLSKRSEYQPLEMMATGMGKINIKQTLHNTLVTAFT